VDPLTQGVLGAALPQGTAATKDFVAIAGILGFLAGLSADLDVLIRSSSDPLLFLEYHRQFTHSLIFIPVGGLLCALLLHPLLGKRRKLHFRQTLLFCSLGYATHALLDACTSYGTMLFWPFSEVRIAWNTISIIDPLFTLPMLVLIVWASIKKRPVLSRFALLWGFTYMGLGLWQRDQAMEMGYQIAMDRGHSPLRLEVKPSFANILVWKTVYETQSTFYVDAVRATLSPAVFPGSSLGKLNLARDLPWLDRDSQQARDIERFKWFSDGYIALDPLHENRIIDIRYSMIPNQMMPLWSIELSPKAPANGHVSYRVHRETVGEPAAHLDAMIFGW